MNLLPSMLSGIDSENLQTLFKEGLGDIAKDGASEIIRRVLRHRRDAAFNILLSQLRRGSVSSGAVAAESDVVSVMLRYVRAADEGAAALNLRLMAKVISGCASKGNLKADTFLYYAEMLASLRREEIVLIATMHKLCKELPQIESHATELWKKLQEELVPSLFKDEHALRAAAMACLRTGLLMDINTMDNMGLYSTSPLMFELESLAPFEEALEEDR